MTGTKTQPVYSLNDCEPLYTMDEMEFSCLWSAVRWGGTCVMGTGVLGGHDSKAHHVMCSAVVLKKKWVNYMSVDTVYVCVPFKKVDKLPNIYAVPLKPG